MSESKADTADSERATHGSRWWPAVAALVGAVAMATAFQGFWSSDFTAMVPVPSRLFGAEGAPPGRIKPVIEADYRMAVWAVGRNAHSLAHAPSRLFAAEPCYPTANALALHHPVITTALVAVPVEWISDDPIATFNGAVLLKVAIGFFAMVLLVFDWTRSAPAAIAAGLLYGFHPVQVEHPYHLFTSDNAWMLFGLFFARRLFERGRWVDAIGLAVSCILQMGASFYPFFAAAVAALPILGWLVWHYGVKSIPIARILFVAAAVAGGAALLFAPYLAHEATALSDRARVFHAPWSTFLSGGSNAIGWLTALLALAAFAPGRGRTSTDGSCGLRFALAFAALLVALLATGGNYQARVGVLSGGQPPPFALPNLFAALAGILPGLTNVRLPGEFAPAARTIVCLLAGLGAASLLRRLPDRAAVVAALLLVFAAFAQSPGLPGLRSSEPPFDALAIRPPEAALAFFAALDTAGNRGPLLELPIDRSNRGYTFRVAPEQQLLTAYHHRRTSGCYLSFIPQPVRDLAALGRELPGPAALERARKLGFTTIIVHQDRANAAGRATERRFRNAISAGEPGLVLLATDAVRSAYGLSGVDE